MFCHTNHFPAGVVFLFPFVIRQSDRKKKGEKKMPVCNVSLQVVPRVEEEAVYSVVDQVIAHIHKKGIPCIVGPMETTMEGELEVLLEVVKEAQEICVRAGASRVLSVVKIDYSPKGVTMDEKVGKYRG